MSVGDIRLHRNVIREVHLLVKYGPTPPVPWEAVIAVSQHLVVQRHQTCCKRAEGSITYAINLTSLPLF